MGSEAGVDPRRFLGESPVGLLTTYRRDGSPVATPVSVAVRDGSLYFVTPATSGKVRRLMVAADVTVAPCTVRGVPTGPAVPGRARRLDDSERRLGRRLLRPGSPLFWSYLLYRVRGMDMQLYEVTFT